MKTPSISAVLLILAVRLSAQCTYLAYEGWNHPPSAAMHGQSGGTGWQSPWEVQNENTAIPGYQTSAASLMYNDLQTTDNHGAGGKSYLTAGRRLNTSDTGPFIDYVAEYENGIGTKTGDTLWVSVILSKSVNNNQPVYVDLHDDPLSWCTSCASQHIGFGYFGSSSNANNQKWWTLRMNGNYHISNIPVTIGSNVFIVARIIFNAGNTQVALFINPPSLGNTIPSTPTISQTINGNQIIRSMAVYMGDSTANGKLDEIRFASSYPCVAPDASIPVNLPPVAVISLTPQTGQIPLSVTLNGSSSIDPEDGALTYTWDLGDGSGTSSLPTLTHIYNVTGEIEVRLTVTDNYGLEHTAHATLILTDENNTYSCQTTVSCLQMASCGLQNGKIRVNAPQASFTLTNSQGTVQNITNGNEYHNLAPGMYHLYADGNNSQCTDSIDLFIVTDSTTCAGWQPDNCTMDIGTNMSGIADWSVERPFKNRFKNIRSEVIGYGADCYCWDSGVADEMSFDENGYPTFIPQTTSAGNTYARYVISAGGGNLQEDSTYVVRYDGTGTVSIGGNATIVSTSPGRLVFKPLDQGNFSLNITLSLASNRVRNIRLLRLADEFDNLTLEPFYDGFINRIVPFKTLRFMDWGATNNSPLETWSNRSKVTWFTYGTEAGVPYEMMIRLANQLNKDVWICVPHLADSTFISNMATLFRDSLNSQSMIYLEYSNELWNWIFGQAQYNDQHRPSNLNYGRAGAERAKKVFRIWHEVFGTQSCRVKRVLGLQAGYNGLNEDIIFQLKQEDWDMASPSFYFHLNHTSSGNPVLGPGSTVQHIMQNAANEWNVFRPTVRRDYMTVRLTGKDVVGYEGGQHFVGNAFGNPYPYQQSMWNAQNSQEMYHFYNQLLDTIRRWDCRMAAHFSLASEQESIYGSWGALPDIDIQPPYSQTAKKYQAILDNIPSATCYDLRSWEGTVSVNWNNPCNWQPSRLPNESSTVTIKANTPFSPHVNADSFVKKVTLFQNAHLTLINGKTLRVKE